MSEFLRLFSLSGALMERNCRHLTVLVEIGADSRDECRAWRSDPSDRFAVAAVVLVQRYRRV